MSTTDHNHQARAAQPETVVNVAIPHVPYPGPTSDAEFIRGAAWRLRLGYAVGGSNVTATVADLLDRVATAADGLPPREVDDSRRARRDRFDDALDLVRAAWHAAHRWQDPLTPPQIVTDLVAVLGEDARCDCDQCATAETRAARTLL